MIKTSLKSLKRLFSFSSDSNRVVTILHPSEDNTYPPKADGYTRFVVLSDTHSQHEHIIVPDGDVLIHAGDFSYTGDYDEVRKFSNWLGKLPHAYKIVIAGNHEMTFDTEYYRRADVSTRYHDTPLDPIVAQSHLKNCIYLMDTSFKLDEKIHIYGSPWQPEFCDWAFNLPRGPAIMEKWRLIPTDVDILITHGPPKGHGGTCTDGFDAGCEDLLHVVKKIQPAVHIFGHIHEGYGVTKEGGTYFINGSNCTAGYNPTNKPIVFDFYKKTPSEKASSPRQGSILNLSLSLKRSGSSHAS